MFAYLLAIIGLPIWEPAAATNERFACQHRRCGCRTAAQCWTSCCCFSMEERVAWAKANKAAIPAQALTIAAREKSEKVSAKAKSCGHCCANKPTKVAGKSNESTRTGRVVWVDRVQAQKCKGVNNGWMTLAMPVFPPPKSVAMEIEFLPIGQVSLADVREISRPDRPATRPG